LGDRARVFAQPADERGRELMTWVLLIVGMWGGQPFTAQIQLESEAWCSLARTQILADFGSNTFAAINDPQGLKITTSCFQTKNPPGFPSK
jgi:hypothetical protein